METISILSIYSMFIIGTFIVYELLKTLGFWNWTIEATYTHPKFDLVFFIIGDILFAIGTGVIASAAYSYFVKGAFYLNAAIYGIITITLGSIFKEYFKKG